MEQDIHCQRRLCDFLRPDMVLDESEFAALIVNNIASKPNPASFLILADPGDGSTELISRLETNLRSFSDIEINLAKIHAKDLKPPKFPYSVQCLFAKDICKPLERLKIKWFSLTFTQRASLLFAYVLYLSILHTVSVFFTAWKSHALLNLSFEQLYHIPSITSFTIQSILGSILPIFAIILWKSAWRALSNEDLENKRESIIRMLRQNKYLALRHKFNKVFVKKYAPLIIILDSLDDLKNPFDYSFIFHTLQESYTSAGYLLINITICKSSSIDPTKILKDLPNVKVFSLLNLTAKQIEEITGEKPAINLTIKEALAEDIRGVNHANLSNEISRYKADYEDNCWNPWSVLCLLSASTYIMREGFTRKYLKRILQSNIHLLNNVAHSFEIKDQLTTQKIDSILNGLLDSERTQKWISFDEIRRMQPFLQKQIIAKAPFAWRFIGYIFWISVITSEMENNISNFAYLELANITEYLITGLISFPQKIPPLPMIKKILVEALEKMRNTGYSDVCHRLAFLFYMLLGHTLEDETIGEDDTLALECMLLYGIGKGSDINELNNYLNDRSVSNPLLKLLGKIQSRKLDERKKAFNFISKYHATVQPQIRVSLDWLHINALRDHSIIPVIAMKLRDRSLPMDFSLESVAPANAGGFNLGTYAALCMLSDSNYLDDSEAFCQTWNATATGLQTYANRSVLTDWERLWVQFISLVLLTELTEFLSNKIDRAVWTRHRYLQSIELNQGISIEYHFLKDILQQIGIDAFDPKINIMPVSWFKKAEELFGELHLKFLLLSLSGLDSLLSYYQARFTVCVHDFTSFQELLKEETIRDMRKGQHERPPLIRETLPIEFLLLSYMLDVRLHKKLAARYISQLIKDIEGLGSPIDVINNLYDIFIEDLRFSDSDEDNKAAIRLQLRKHRRLYRSSSPEDTSNQDKLNRADFYGVLANDLQINRRLSAAKKSWLLAKSYLDDYSGSLQDERSVNHLRKMEVKLFCQEVRIWNKSGKVVGAEIERLLSAAEYRAIGGHEVLALILLALKEPIVSLNVIEKVIINLEGCTDWFGGYLLSSVFSRLVIRMLSCSKPDRQEKMSSLVNKVFGHLKNADQTAIMVDETLDALLRLIVNLAQKQPKINIAHFETYRHELMKSQLAAIYRETLATWMLERKYGAIADAYYRLLRPYLIPQLPEDIAKWTDVDDYQQFTKGGFSLLKKYQKTPGKSTWPIIHIIKHMELRARREKDEEIKKTLGNAWLLVSVQCVEGLIEALNRGNLLSSDFKEILSEHLKGIHAATSKQDSDKDPDNVLNILNKYENG